MNTRLELLAVSLLLVTSLVGGCTVDEGSLGRYLEVPLGFEIDGLRSGRDWSGMRGPQYFSFTCDNSIFLQIARMNSLEPIEDFPNQLAVEWRVLAEKLVKTDNVRDWPAEEMIEESIVYSDLNRILDKPDDEGLLRLAFHIGDRAYFVAYAVD